MIPADGYDFVAYEKRRKDVVEVLDGIINGEVPIDEKLIVPSGKMPL
ncbi:hypothetical protein [Paracerasibacillus soli]|uniref:Uncharacterized protein n=1 Tax=Paracerasibacillus soli TaxID=480284 RepID=A0ABU5CV34_9BACI|nr:hypothetical protein [Virgibacillus soli]MDY0409268.1 hypothetical protein [Virgibacillus soli]